MPINKQQRLQQAREILEKHFPSITDETQIARICELISEGFRGDYSPLDKEKNNLRGIGTGATFRGYCLVVAGTISRMDPIGVPEEKYYEALRKVYTC